MVVVGATLGVDATLGVVCGVVVVVGVVELDEEPVAVVKLLSHSTSPSVGTASLL